jgi:dsRNA-specific ribonuclease
LLPGLDFPEKVVKRMITHPSWKAGFEGHNNRLAFLGKKI